MKNILIVDDQKEIRDLFSNFLTDELGEVDFTFCADGIEAFIKTSTLLFDAIILDHQMPRLNGLDLLVALRNTAGLNQYTPIVIISAYLPDIPQTTSAIKDVFFLSKPFDFNDLSTILKNFFK